MLSILNLHGSYGLPLCVSGISHPLAFSMEIADHDLRRESIKKHRSQTRQGFVANRNMGTERNFVRELKKIKQDEISEDLNNLSCSYRGCTAKAA
ncbi:hypothetical protein FRX31_017775 [Thalictrum thalictroides]|uniref:Uncharacterized protein n=1 Tax=Thalictrum thalictroides TaxID=46969 RepID=A0A7J6W767_THATH|nr:hypothetical protein FRX31_017775 [Thalictrum thalictroides]